MRKNLIYIAAIVLLFAAAIMTDFMSMSWEVMATADYWLKSFATQMPVIAIVFLSRSLFKNREKLVNEVYCQFRSTIDDGYRAITKEGFSEKFEEHIAEDNKARKYNAYYSVLSRKLSKVEGKINELENKNKTRQMKLDRKAAKRSIKKGREIKAREHNVISMILSLIRSVRLGRRENNKQVLEYRIGRVEKDIEYIKVKYPEVKSSIIFGATEKKAKDDENLSASENTEYAFIIFSRIGLVMMFGIILTSFIAFDVHGTVFEIVFNAVVKALQMVFGVFAGMTSGIDFVKGKLTDKMRLRVSYVQKFINKARAGNTH